MQMIVSIVFNVYCIDVSAADLQEAAKAMLECLPLKDRDLSLKGSHISYSYTYVTIRLYYVVLLYMIKLLLLYIVLLCQYYD